jgi:hypothetical protein
MYNPLFKIIFCRMIYFYLLFLFHYTCVFTSETTLIAAGTKRPPEYEKVLPAAPAVKRVHWETAFPTSMPSRSIAGAKREPERDADEEDVIARSHGTEKTAVIDREYQEREQKLAAYQKVLCKLEDNQIIVDALREKYTVAHCKYMGQRLGSLPVSEEYRNNLIKTQKAWQKAQRNLILPYQITRDQLYQELWPSRS